MTDPSPHPIDALLAIDPSAMDDFDRRVFKPIDQRWDGEGPMPLLRLLGGRDVPHLREIHPRRWEQALLPLGRPLRLKAIHTTGMSVPEIGAGHALLRLMDAPPEELAQRAIAERAGVLPDPPAPSRPPTRQVNVRLSIREHAELAAAAEIAGTRPTTFARWLLLSGSRRVLADTAATYAAVRGDGPPGGPAERR